MSLAMRNHIVLPATRHKWTEHTPPNTSFRRRFFSGQPLALVLTERRSGWI